MDRRCPIKITEVRGQEERGGTYLDQSRLQPYVSIGS
jgi:hypothetical protein